MPKKLKRPLVNLYYTDARGGLPVAQGACKTDKGSRHGASYQVFALRKYRRVETVDTRTGLLVESLSITTTGHITHNVDCAGQESKGYRWRQKLAEQERKKRNGRKWA